MDKVTESVAQLNKARKKTLAGLIAVFVCVLAGVIAFLKFYDAFIDKTLYAERLNQMREVTTQLFSGLEDVVRNQWRLVDEQCRVLQESQPEAWDELQTFMKNQSYLADLDAIQSDIVAVDDNGMYYTQHGRQGLVQERQYLASQPEQISYVSNSLITDEARMVFLKKLRRPIVIQDGDGTFKINYYGISQDMEELNPYFECAAYSGNSSVYVVDHEGLKLFSNYGNNGNLLKGFNVYNILGEMAYLHGTDFDTAKKELDENNLAYSNALLGETELYYVLYRMDNAAWTLIFLVPSEYVAVNTVDLVNTTIRLVILFAVALIVVSVAVIFWIINSQQKVAVQIERQNNVKLERLNVKLEAASQAKTDFLANMSHDIRTPMNAIVGITKLMAHDKDDPDKMETYIRKVQMSSQHLLSLINDVLDMSKIESSQVTLNHEPVSLAEQVGQVESIVRPQTDEKNQEFLIHVRNITHEHLVGDAVRLRQIFINLLSNAVKYTPNGGRIEFDLEELPSEKKGYVCLRIIVVDNGYGMKPEFVGHIFEAFTRAENSTTNRVQGTGLGMAITKNIVDLMGGTISVQSELDKGSCFTVELLFEIDNSIQEKLAVETVLLITDEDRLIHNVEAAFKETEVALYAARSEEETDRLLREKDIGLVLLGGHLQGQILAEHVHRLREATGNAILVYCCDYSEQVQVRGMVTNGDVDGLIVRPFFLSNLLRVVDRIRNEVPINIDEGESVLKGMRFLCAEDNTLNAEILEAVLDMNGARCTIFPNGQAITDAFESVQPGDYDAILMDVQMPVMNGLDATRAIRRSSNPLGQTIPIIAMTANAFSEDVQNCLNAGMDAHVSKPLDISVLERTMQSFVGGDRPKTRMSVH